MYDRALTFASRLHKGQSYGDMPYVYHLLGVESKVREVFRGDSTARTVAILHDTLEDTPITYRELLQVFGMEISDAVVALTRTDDEEYDEYLEKVKRNPTALLVKKADVLFNLEHSIAESNYKRIAKYSRALEKLL